MRARNPCVRARLRFFGWYVRFTAWGPGGSAETRGRERRSIRACLALPAPLFSTSLHSSRGAGTAGEIDVRGFRRDLRHARAAGLRAGAIVAAPGPTGPHSQSLPTTCHLEAADLV